jgi:8-oxo-dGTP pyrophosphatase MutT (NUDIX family)
LAVLNRILSELELMFRRPPKQQFGAICYRPISDGNTSDIEVLLITSRDTGRWVIPKGWPMGSKKSHAVAEREAYEEAGVKGKAEKDSFGSFIYDKAMPGGLKVPCEVKVYLLRVNELLESYPEKGTRKLEWVSCEEAANRVREPQLKRLFHLLSLSRKRDAAKADQATPASVPGLD